MADVTVRQFAESVGIPVDRLLIQLGEAGIDVDSENTKITDKQKVDLLAHLRKSHGKQGALDISEPKKITLKRKSHQEIKLPSGMGLVKTVSVEVRRKRTYVKRSSIEESKNRNKTPQEKALEAQQQAELEALRKAEEESRRRAEIEEARRRAEEEAKRQAEEEARRRAEEEVRRQAEEEAKRRAEEEAKRRAEEEARQQAAEEVRRQAEAIRARKS
ncbi:MAG: translation initiation factor IF-2, partial [Phycisphaerae bacterium]|nr:translation initiation factor IF-2 [Phycisphaerae bacterium]